MTVSNSSGAAGALIADLSAGSLGNAGQPETAAARAQAMERLAQDQSKEFDNALTQSVAQGAANTNSLNVVA